MIVEYVKQVMKIPIDMLNFLWYTRLVPMKLYTLGGLVMGRPKGSKNKKTKAQAQAQEQEQLQAQEKLVKKRRTRTRIKKIINNSNTEKIKNTLDKARKN